MKTKDFLLGLIVGLPVGLALIVLKFFQKDFGWPVQGRNEMVAAAVVCLFLAIVVSNVIRKSKAGAWLHVAASDVPLESFLAEFFGMFVAAFAVSVLALAFI